MYWRDWRALSGVKFLRLEDFLDNRRHGMCLQLEPQGILFMEVLTFISSLFIIPVTCASNYSSILYLHLSFKWMFWCLYHHYCYSITVESCSHRPLCFFSLLLHQAAVRWVLILVNKIIPWSKCFCPSDTVPCMKHKKLLCSFPGYFHQSCNWAALQTPEAEKNFPQRKR